MNKKMEMQSMKATMRMILNLKLMKTNRIP